MECFRPRPCDWADSRYHDRHRHARGRRTIERRVSRGCWARRLHRRSRGDRRRVRTIPRRDGRPARAGQDFVKTHRVRRWVPDRRHIERGGLRRRPTCRSLHRTGRLDDAPLDLRVSDRMHCIPGFLLDLARPSSAVRESPGTGSLAPVSWPWSRVVPLCRHIGCRRADSHPDDGLLRRACACSARLPYRFRDSRSPLLVHAVGRDRRRLPGCRRRLLGRARTRAGPRGDFGKEVGSTRSGGPSRDRFAGSVHTQHGERAVAGGRRFVCLVV